jgi:protein-disulfide isomerase
MLGSPSQGRLPPPHESRPVTVKPRSPQLSTRTTTPPPASRRERRAAERASASAGRGVTGQRRQGSPILIITLLVGAIGIVLIAGLLLLQGGGSTAGATGTALNPPSAPTPTELAADRTLGKSTAPVTLEVWSDFQCPVCGQFARTVEPALIAKYVTSGTLRIVHQDAAFQGAKSHAAYDESVEAAAGARCAAIQGRYWPFQDWLFANQIGENQGAFSADRLKAIAAAAGLDVAAWQACVATGDQQKATRDETSKSLAGGINATPTLNLNGQVIVGLKSVPELSALIDAAAAGG